jgi:hypothetical protein
VNDDILSRATRALREETRGDDASARFTRSRIMASAHEQRVKRRTRLAFLLPIAATFAAATAWGAANGKIGRAFEAVSEALGVAPDAAPTATPPKRSSPRRGADVPSASVVAAPTLAPTVPPLAEPAPVPPLEEAATAGAPVAAAPVLPVERAPVSAASDSAGSGSRDPALELYRAAHRAHFVERDAARALPAWDAYLKAAPNGSLALEARYNRALCLVRLHRSTEARAALTPFAAGRFGGYRKREAADLLDALPPELAGPGD